MLISLPSLTAAVCKIRIRLRPTSYGTAPLSISTPTVLPAQAPLFLLSRCLTCSFTHSLPPQPRVHILFTKSPYTIVMLPPCGRYAPGHTCRSYIGKATVAPENLGGAAAPREKGRSCTRAPSRDDVGRSGQTSRQQLCEF